MDKALRAVGAAIGISTMLMASGAAHANLIIAPTFAASITTDPNAAAIEGVINSAIGFYENTFTDPITVAIEFGSQTSGLGTSTAGFYNVPYSTYLSALKADASTANDATANSLLANTATNPVNGASTIDVKSANGRAVGLATPGFVDGSFDGSILVNTHITDVGSPGTAGLYSLFATVEHEIDEVLGLGSALPSLPLGTIFPEDLFRYTSGGVRSFTSNPAATAFFSIDGTTDLAQFDNQNDGGDFGDWQSNPLPSGVQPQVQDAFGAPGAHPTLSLTSPETIALDVIGYNAVTPTAVPEPATIALVALGFAALGFSRRRRTG